MGFKVENMTVFTDHDIDDFAITKFREGNSPCFGKYKKEKLELFSFYYRNGLPRKTLGDNCPFLYALKKRDGLTLDKYAIKDLRLEFYEIANILFLEITKKYGHIDFIIPMPSSHPFSRILAKILQKKYFKESVINEKLLQKKSNQDVYQQIKSLNISPKEINRLLQPIKIAIKHSENFSMAKFPPKDRYLIDPIKVMSPIIINGNYLLIDDITASGSTFISAKKAIHSINSNANVLATSLFSPVNNRTR